MVGQRGPLENRARSATVTAASPMLTWAIARERFLGVVGGNPALAARMHEEVAKRYEKEEKPLSAAAAPSACSEAARGSR